MLKAYYAVRKFFAQKQEGATLAEYALLLALIAVACIAAIGILGGRISTLFTDIATALNVPLP
jgi:pilus assembly protein Flp/PilA